MCTQSTKKSCKIKLFMSRKKNENDGESRQKLYCQEKREHKWFLQSISSENQSYNRIHFNCVYDIKLFHMVKVDISAEFIFLMQRYYITYFQPQSYYRKFARWKISMKHILSFHGQKKVLAYIKFRQLFSADATIFLKKHPSA